MPEMYKININYLGFSTEDIGGNFSSLILVDSDGWFTGYSTDETKMVFGYIGDEKTKVYTIDFADICAIHSYDFPAKSSGIVNKSNLFFEHPIGCAHITYKSLTTISPKDFLNEIKNQINKLSMTGLYYYTLAQANKNLLRFNEEGKQTEASNSVLYYRAN